MAITTVLETRVQAGSADLVEQHAPTTGDDNNPPDEPQESPPEGPVSNGRRLEHDHSPNMGIRPGSSKLQVATLMTCLCACVFIAALDITIVTTALPTIANQFASNAGYTWIGTSFTLAHTASTPSWGKVSDIWGRKPMLMGANAIFFAGSLMCALVGDMDSFIAGRVLQGLGAGGMQTIVNICISDLFSQRDRGFYYGLTSVVWALASGVGPVMGGVFTSRLSWRWCFWINLPITGAVFPLLFFTLKMPNPKTPMRAGLKAIDWTGSFLIIGGALMLLIGLHLGGVHDPWHSATVVCLIVFGFVAGGLFVVNEWKLAEYPVIPLHLFRTWSSSAAYSLCFLHAFAFMGVAYYLPLYFQAVLLASPLMSGVYLLPFIVSSSISAALTGVYIQRSGRYLPAVYTGLVAMTLGIGLLANLEVDADWVKMVIYQLIGGAGFGMNLEGPLLAVQADVQVRDVATATAVMGFIRTISTAISIVLGGVVFQNEMGRRKGMLENGLGPDLAQLLDGGSAAANVELVRSLPPGQRVIARRAFYESTRSMWIMYVCFSALGLLLGGFIKGHPLKKEHEVTEVGLRNLTERQRSGSREDSPMQGEVG
ncbi:putative transporter-like protein [Hapsidospora chrysogenum ATCC 11550]|uniref:Efflux pump dotC n=1 Tax=Hapsidospora chrysogenum (strain ATCC 11550 / CBS 779.69 / DSM 880 / IAM 14645 / JCM 23072 / IMI 49137) TaxID=857340 RepID=A0A086SZD4_HAPC1|nr:putative transporter-like protein [Hapsidospora chrysogenum ATCC 11550]